MKKQEIDINKLKQLYETTPYTLTEISNQLGCSYDVIRNRIKKYNLKRPQNLVDLGEINRINRIKKTESNTKKTHNNINNTTYKCTHCNNIFTPSRQQINNYKSGKNIFCSTNCRNKYLCKSNKTVNSNDIKLKCCMCGKDIECTPDRYIRFKKGETNFYCSKSCVMKYSNSHIDMDQRNNTIKQLYKDEYYKDKVLQKTKATNIKKYGVDNPFKTPQVKLKISNVWKSYTDEEKVYIAKKRSWTRKKNLSSDGIYFDSSYELLVYEYCKRNEIPVQRQVPIHYNYNGKDHYTIIDFIIDGYYVECKGGHLLNGIYNEIGVPIEEKLKVYKEHNVIIVTDKNGSNIIPKANSSLSNGLKYKNKCPQPLIGIDIELFNNPKFPYRPDRPKCFYDVSVMGEKSIKQAFMDEQLRWKMIKNRIEYSGGFIDAKWVLQAMNITRTCKQPSWFSEKFAEHIINSYITTETIYDTFAGWGARADACKKLDIQYNGYDLNEELVYWHKQFNRNIQLADACNVKTDNSNCSVFICPPYQNIERYFESQNIQNTQCDWLKIVMKNIPNAKEYVMVCKIVDSGWEKYIVEEKVNKSHFGINKEYVIKVTQEEKQKIIQ